MRDKINQLPPAEKAGREECGIVGGWSEETEGNFQNAGKKWYTEEGDAKEIVVLPTIMPPFIP